MNPSSNSRYTPPLVSVVVVNYNYGRFLRDAVDSVFAQTYPNIECIIVDDASTDETPAVLAAIATAHPSATIVRRPVNGGMSAATLSGFDASNGDYVLFLDADDLLFEQCIATHVFVHLSLRLPVGFSCSDLVQMVGDRLVVGSWNSIYYHISAPAAAKPAVRAIEVETAGSWSASGVDRSVLDRLYSVETTSTTWPWTATSAFFYRRDALNFWVDARGLAEQRYATDAFFALGINALTGSVIIDQALGAYRIHGVNMFSKRAQLTHLRQYEEQDDFRPACRTLLLDHATREAARFRRAFFHPHLFKIVLDTLDTPDTSPDAPAWAKHSRLSTLLLQEHASLAKVLGERPLVRWMIEKGTPVKTIEDAGIKVRLFDQIAGKAVALYLKLSERMSRLRAKN